MYAAMELCRLTAAAERTDINMNYLDYFKELCAIPHGSGNTRAVSDYVVAFARTRALRYIQDEAGNVIIFKEASAGREQDPGVMIQGHLDMVTVKDPDCDIDFLHDPLTLETDGDFLYAKGTSLGGDDGIAVAMALAILDSEISHPRLECVFTVDEEVGMLGAAALNMSPLSSRYMLNMDSEDEGVLTVSCAGGARVSFDFPITRENAVGEGLKVTLSGLTGGHSGVEIHKNRTNAILMLLDILRELSSQISFRISDIHGGSADNAIPSSCQAVIVTEKAEHAAHLLNDIALRLLTPVREKEPGAALLCEAAVLPEAVITSGVQNALLGFTAELPNGVIAMNKEMEDMVETSSNLGTIQLDSDKIHLVCAPRSASDAEKDDLIRTFMSLAQTHGAIASVSGEYPGWPLRKESRLVPLMSEIYEKMYGKKPEVVAIHAGLECGIFSQHMPDLDIVSYGPDLFDIHSPKERLSLSSAERTWKYTEEILKQIH